MKKRIIHLHYILLHWLINISMLSIHSITILFYSSALNMCKNDFFFFNLSSENTS